MPGRPPDGQGPALRWSIAVVFLVGGLHAWCCVGFNARAVLDQGSVNIVSLGLAVLAGVMYLRAFYEVFEGLPDTRRFSFGAVVFWAVILVAAAVALASLIFHLPVLAGLFN